MLEILEKFVVNHWAKIDTNGTPLTSFSLTIGGPNRKELVHYNAQNPGDIDAFSESILASSKKNCVSICVYNNKTPVAWAKVTENESYFHIIQQEYQNLAYAHGKASHKLKKTIPAPVGLETSNGHCFYLQRYTSGQTMSEQITPLMYFSQRKVRKEFQVIKHWLLDFQAQTQQDSDPCVKQVAEQGFLLPYQALIEATCTTEKQTLFTSVYEQRIKSLADVKIPTVSAHGDFFALNIIFDKRNAMSVIDWCDFEQESNPFLDLFTLISTFRLPGKNNKENIMSSLEYSFLKKNWFSKFLKAFVRDYCASLNYDYELVTIYYPIFLMNRIKREERLSAHVTPQYWREHLDLYIEHEERFWY